MANEFIAVRRPIFYFGHLVLIKSCKEFFFVCLLCLIFLNKILLSKA